MNQKEVFILAQEYIRDVVDQIKDDQWSMPVPAGISMSSADKEITLKELINTLAYDSAWVPAMLAGKTMKEVGEESFKGDLLGENPKQNYLMIAAKSIEAAGKIEDLESTVHCSFGDFPAKEYLSQIMMYYAFSGYDIAKLLGINLELSDELATGLYEIFIPNAEDWRAMGLFGPKIEVSEDARVQDKLLALAGKQY